VCVYIYIFEQDKAGVPPLYGIYIVRFQRNTEKYLKHITSTRLFMFVTSSESSLFNMYYI
jgi:hypothetical protein